MHPVLAQFGSVQIKAYPVFIGLGFVIGALTIVIVSRREARTRGFLISDIINTVFLGGLVMFIGAKVPGIVLVLSNQGEFTWEGLRGVLASSQQSGAMYFGSLFALMLFLWGYVRKKFRGSALFALDVTALSLAVGQCIGRIGCFLAGCCYGRPTELPWGVNFLYLGGHIHPWCGRSLHPTQLYESLLDLLNFVALAFLFRRRRFDGQVFALYSVNYGIIRFVLEYLRGDVHYLVQGSCPLLSLTLFQGTSALLLIAGLSGYRVLKARSPALAP